MKSQTITLLCIFFFAFTFSSHASFPVKRSIATSQVQIESTTEEKSSISPAAAGAGQSKGVALLLALTLGLLAGHRWYLGTIWVYNIFFIMTLGGVGIWLLADIIRIITGDLGPNNGRYKETLF